MKKKRYAVIAALLLLVQFALSASPLSTAAVSANTELEYQECASVSAGTDVKVSSRFFELLFGKKGEDDKGDQTTKDEITLCPGGDVFGVKIARDSVSVMACEEECILHKGDLIISINGERIRSLLDVKRIMENADGTPLNLVIERGGERFEAEVIPKKDGEAYKIGAVLREGVAGIGTVT
jgi:hypothetical protein